MKLSSRNLEFTLLFIILPISLCLKYHIYIKLALCFIAIMYAGWISYKEGLFKRSYLFRSGNRAYWKDVFIRLIPTALFLFVLMFIFKKDLLFNVLLNKPGLFIMIIFIYTFLSVFPQEFIYRVFYFNRYAHFFKKEWVLILINALLFSLAHIMFMNVLVLIMTFVGGLLFALTYVKSKSYVMTSIEHSLYGLWLFTLGAGDMLAFPS